MTDFSGTWMVLSSPDFDYDYLSLQVKPYLTSGKEATGSRASTG